MDDIGYKTIKCPRSAPICTYYRAATAEPFDTLAFFPLGGSKKEELTNAFWAKIHYGQEPLGALKPFFSSSKISTNSNVLLN